MTQPSKAPVLVSAIQTLFEIRVLDLLADSENGTLPLADVVRHLRGFHRMPGRLDAQTRMLEQAGFTVTLVSKKTGEPATSTKHGSYVRRVSL